MAINRKRVMFGKKYVLKIKIKNKIKNKKFVEEKPIKVAKMHHVHLLCELAKPG